MWLTSCAKYLLVQALTKHCISQAVIINFKRNFNNHKQNLSIMWRHPLKHTSFQANETRFWRFNSRHDLHKFQRQQSRLPTIQFLGQSLILFLAWLWTILYLAQFWTTQYLIQLERFQFGDNYQRLHFWHDYKQYSTIQILTRLEKIHRILQLKLGDQLNRNNIFFNHD